MKSYNVIIEPRAEIDLRKRYSEITEDSPLNGVRWFNRMNEAILSLNKMPTRCPRAPENSKVEGVELRHLIIRKSRVIFTIAEEAVHVLHVRHGARLAAEGDEMVMPPKDDDRSMGLEELKAEVRIGLDELERGEGSSGTQAIDEVRNRLKNKKHRDS